MRKTFEASSTLAKSLRAQLETAKTEAAAAMDDEASIEGMVRNAEIKRTRYADLVKRTGELETERRILTGSTRLVSLAELPQEPFSPKAVPFLGGGIVLAGVLAAAAALLRDVTDRRVRTSAQLMAGTGAPVFAQLPCLETAGLVGRFSDRHRELELPRPWRGRGSTRRCRTLLRNLHAHLVLAGGKASRVILVTSSKPREGKSFTAFAMAGIGAANGRRVLVVECDLRRPNFEASLGLGRGPGARRRAPRRDRPGGGRGLGRSVRRDPGRDAHSGFDRTPDERPAWSTSSTGAAATTSSSSTRRRPAC